MAALENVVAHCILAFLVILVSDLALNFSILILAVFFDQGDGLVVTLFFFFKNNFLRARASDFSQIKNSLSLKSGKLRTNMHFSLK